MKFKTKEELVAYMRHNGMTPPDEFIRLGMIVAANRRLDTMPTLRQVIDDARKEMV